ncbi:Glycosyltransferase involved in cell wall bisynthesis [Luteibacter sp. UNCMF331Sha3.1]|uniref:glycosyltransferase family 2 protein n=1 Tax=Luteibacter sp. UNCMF331Sha3.1 TaxID=1502760 RepID=UPI0008AE83EF|nr:glycosyltransferase family 2 protein [Luteibacter sp. UNCMF331Sha3.1]SEN44314.1 Glycosyltransferase involved in cell wall bisynthesis [Luteibacter sp. UNCMF331Sha3.1]
MRAEPLSVVFTTFNNADTIGACLASVAFADDVVVLDSGSTDATHDIAASHGARVEVRPFAGYSAQKQAAIDLARHRWVLLLDSDESLPAAAAARIEAALTAPTVAGFVLLRREWVFWRWQADRARMNHYVRLFDRTRARMSGHEVHESVVVDGPVGRLDVVIDHYGERDIEGRVAKANAYSSLQVRDRHARTPAFLRTRMVMYPTVAFARYYFWRGHWRAGWAGFVAARVHAFYAFLKYAKLYELRRSGGQREGRPLDTERREK